MINYKSISFLLILPLFFGGKQTATAQTEKGLLWEISGNGLKKSSYLYGTIHIQAKKVFQYDKVVEEKLMSCKAFAPELVLDELNQKDLTQAMMMKDNSLDKLLTAEEYAQADKIVKEKTGAGLAAFNKLKPIMVASQIGQLDIPQEMPMALDLYLLEIARNTKMKVFAVETLEEQIAALNSISDADQAKMLVKLLQDSTSGAGEYQKLLQAYLSQDLGQMLDLTEDPTLPKEIEEKFLVARNHVMAQRIAGFVTEQTTFVAIGAAHLGGSLGVLALLKMAGYQVNPIPFEFKN